MGGRWEKRGWEKGWIFHFVLSCFSLPVGFNANEGVVAPCQDEVISFPNGYFTPKTSHKVLILMLFISLAIMTI